MSTTAPRTVETIWKEISDLREEITSLRKATLNKQVDDFTLTDLSGNPVRLSQLFGDKSDLIVVHNMGRACNYCTLWADGFRGYTKHLLERTAFVLCSADDWQTAKAHSEARGWNFPVVSGAGSDFAERMGYKVDGHYWPGATSFYKDSEGNIFRSSNTLYGPGDDFCAVWPFFDLLKDGPNGWEPS